MTSQNWRGRNWTAFLVTLAIGCGLILLALALARSELVKDMHHPVGVAAEESRTEQISIPVGAKVLDFEPPWSDVPSKRVSSLAEFEQLASDTQYVFARKGHANIIYLDPVTQYWTEVSVAKVEHNQAVKSSQISSDGTVTVTLGWSQRDRTEQVLIDSAIIAFIAIVGIGCVAFSVHLWQPKEPKLEPSPS